MDLIKSLHWRYATKKYSDRKLSAQQLDQILEAISLTASSAGMQPYRVFVLDKPELRQALGSDSFNPQITEASHLLLFAAATSITADTISQYIRFVAQQREMPEAALVDFKQALEQHLLARTDTENFIWASRQAYIALGTGLIAAAELGIDATPMEGFSGDKLDTLLGLPEKGLKSVVLLALGFRDAEQDAFARLKKVRLPQEVLVTTVA